MGLLVDVVDFVDFVVDIVVAVVINVVLKANIEFLWWGWVGCGVGWCAQLFSCPTQLQ